MTRPDVLLLLAPIILTFWLYGRRIHRQGWQTELCEEQPRHGRTGRPTAAAPSVSASTSEEPGACSSQSSGYYAAIELRDPDPWEDTFDQWRAREKAARQ